jgi:secreted PhoX family phosphatase
MLTCGMASQAWCGEDLWVSFGFGGGIVRYTSKQLTEGGTPTPTSLSFDSHASGLAFDKSHNLWAVTANQNVVRFTAKQLKDLKKNSSPTPGVIITSETDFLTIIGCNFDAAGNLWVVDAHFNSLNEISKAQLNAGSTIHLTPAIVLTSSDLNHPNFLAFDKSGNAWVDSQDSNTLVEFTASQLAAGGSQSGNVIISDDGSTTSLSQPGEPVFDKKGNLWVPNLGSDTVVEFTKGQLASTGSPAPQVKLNSPPPVFSEPWGAAFASNGDLVIMNQGDGKISELTPSQLKASGSPTPKFSITGSDTLNEQIIFGPPS